MTTLFRADGGMERDPSPRARAERFSADDSPATRAEQLTRMHGELSAAVAAHGRLVGANLYEVTVGTAGATVRIEHRLGYAARWAVVDWRRTTPGGSHALERSASDADALTLASYVAGTATVMVW